jgi:hypothetical protein
VNQKVGILKFIELNNMLIHELNNPIIVETPLGKGKAIAWLDYGSEVNTVWKVILYQNGMVRNFYDTEILVYPNKMDGGEIDKTYFNKKTNSI